MIRTFRGNTLTAAVLGIVLWGSASPAAQVQVVGDRMVLPDTTLAPLKYLARPKADLEQAVGDVREKIDAMNAAEDGSWKAAELEVRVADTRLRKLMKSLSR